jgi:hypothetical protein
LLFTAYDTIEKNRSIRMFLEEVHENVFDLLCLDEFSCFECFFNIKSKRSILFRNIPELLSRLEKHILWVFLEYFSCLCSFSTSLDSDEHEVLHMVTL